MTAFEKSLRALDEDALRAGAEELLTLLAEADGVRMIRGDARADGGQKRRDAAAARASAPAAGVSPEKSGGETETAAAGDPASDEAVPDTARARRAYPKTEGTGPAAEETAREDDETLPEPVFPETIAGKDRGEREKRKSREDREARRAQNDRVDREARKAQDDRVDREDPADQEKRDDPENRNDAEERGVRTDREEEETAIRALGAQDGETVDREEARALEKQLQSVSQQRRGRARQSDEDGAHTAAFRGPERQYEGAVGARGTEMRRISDYFRRDSRRYDTGFTTY